MFFLIKMEYSDCHEHGTRKKSESLTGIEPMTSHTPVRIWCIYLHVLFLTEHMHNLFSRGWGPQVK